MPSMRSPTAPARSSAVRPSLPRRRRRGLTTDAGFGVYVHWPFCASKCPYCDFNSHVRAGGIDEPRFLAAYLRELRHWAELAPGRSVRQHLLRRRHAVADVGRRRWQPSSTRSHASGALERRRRDHARGQPVERGGGALPRLSRAPASTACRSACSRSTMPICGHSAVCTARRRRWRRSMSHAKHSSAVSFDLIYARPGQTLRGLARRACTGAGARGPAPVALPADHRAGARPSPQLHARGKLRVPDSEAAHDLLRADAGADAKRRGCRPTRSPTTPRPARSAATTCSTGATASTSASAPARTAASWWWRGRAAPRRPSGSRSAGCSASRQMGHGIVESTPLSRDRAGRRGAADGPAAERGPRPRSARWPSAVCGPERARSSELSAHGLIERCGAAPPAGHARGPHRPQRGGAAAGLGAGAGRPPSSRRPSVEVEVGPRHR